MPQRFYQGLRPHPLIFQEQEPKRQEYDGSKPRQPCLHQQPEYQKCNRNHHQEIVTSV